MISETIKYVNCFFEEIKQQHNSVNDVILKSALVYQYLYLRNFKTCISIDRVLELSDNEMIDWPWEWMPHTFPRKNIQSVRYITLT